MRATAHCRIWKFRHVASVLVDTDVLAAHLTGERRFEPGQHQLYVSAITRAELTAARSANNGQARRLLDAITTIDVDDDVAERAGSIARSSGVPLNDALIAATAMQHDLMLVTYNLFGFRAIDGLRAMAPPTG